MEHILDIGKQKKDLYSIFTKINEGNSILFLGAGASIGEKKFLSNEIIELYEDYLGKSINERDLTKFVDILSADPSFSRNHFDEEVDKMLRKLRHTDEHKIMISLPWREIITTNCDLLVEQAYDDLKSSTGSPYNLYYVKERSLYDFQTSTDERKYIKLNGCISGKDRYPLAFSTKDFESRKAFYKVVLNNLKILSTKISLISIGYSYNDDFGKKLLDTFDSKNYRDKKWIINVDPFPKENALHYYSQEKICIVKISFKEFFREYKEWETNIAEKQVKKKNIKITDSRDHFVTIPPQLLVKLNSSIVQLNNQYHSSTFIKPVDFYKGEEPNYNVIIRGIDVARNKKIVELKSIIQQNKAIKQSTLIPIFFLKGEFGIGKSTFTLRLIHELAKDPDLDLIAFEIIDFLTLKKEPLIELISKIPAKNIVLFCDEVEIDSTFKELLDLRRELSIQQFNNLSVFFIIPIRENILEIFKENRDLKELYEITLDGRLYEEEVIDLLEKLKEVNIIDYRDINARNTFLKKIKNEYNNDSFVSFLSIVSGGQHKNDLLTAYNELSNIAQDAFLYTALLHRYKLHMPASLLKQVISMDWDEFIEKVVKVEGKGIFIQEEVTIYGIDSDLYFRTKHSIIAETLISILIPNKDKQYKLYEKILNSIFISKRNSYLVINLLKILSRKSEFSNAKLNKLYDTTYPNLSEDPYYLLNYAMNLQHRKSIQDLKKALEYLIYAEGLLPFRNHKFTHRRAVINFDLAKLYYEKESELNFTFTYLQEAKDLFQIKLIHDPFSAYSYADYIKLLIWELNSIKLDEEEELQKRIRIEELFEMAIASVTERISWINVLQIEYADVFKTLFNDEDYNEHLDTLYENPKFRPYACILLFNYYNEKGKKFYDKCKSLIEEMKTFTDNNETIKFLFKYYGHNLYIKENRDNLFFLSQNYEFLKDSYPLRYHYYNFVAESYNNNFYKGKRELEKIKVKYYGLNPEFSIPWYDEDGNIKKFEGRIIKRDRSKYKAVVITSLQHTFRLHKGIYDKYKIDDKVKVKLNFYLYGIIAKIVI
jgi:hypothetical protein